MPPCPVGIPLKQIPDGRAWASPLQPPLSGHAFGVETGYPQGRQRRFCFFALVNLNGKGLFLFPHTEAKKGTQEPGGYAGVYLLRRPLP